VLSGLRPRPELRDLADRLDVAYLNEDDARPGLGRAGVSDAGTRRDGIAAGRRRWPLLRAPGRGAEQPLGFVKAEVPGVAADQVAAGAWRVRLEATGP
jgi:hypothetical protein